MSEINDGTMDRRHMVIATVVGLAGIAVGGCSVDRDKEPPVLHDPNSVITRANTTTTADAPPSTIPSTTADIPTTTEVAKPAPTTVPEKPPVTLKNYNNAPNWPLGQRIVNGPLDRPYIGLSLDDFFRAEDAGIYLPRILAAARELGIKLTFFPTGGGLEVHEKAKLIDFWRQAIAEGHQIGNHTYSHYDMTRLSKADQIDQIKWVQNYFNDLIGFEYPMSLLRPKGGIGVQGDERIINNSQFMDTVSKLGMYLTGWTLDTNAAGGGETAYLNYLTRPGIIRNGSIVLIHPATFSADNLIRLMDWIVTKSSFNATTISGMFEPISTTGQSITLS